MMFAQLRSLKILSLFLCWLLPLSPFVALEKVVDCSSCLYTNIESNIMFSLEPDSFPTMDKSCPQFTQGIVEAWKDLEEP